MSDAVETTDVPADVAGGDGPVPNGPAPEAPADGPGADAQTSGAVVEADELAFDVEDLPGVRPPRWRRSSWSPTSRS
ncbi:hypothetical protein GCM10025865_28850 [Paraoerskovia sediminicola]|uniref:Uncharacterized protein n=1 Tax=Paraoerskovia sediminicola TaxID=1138587 RepID=A0ABM8G622_9CELL|nr:hypothetical protein GCM10025865_28850 [Paraoerskovia sediminicola]